MFACVSPHKSELNNKRHSLIKQIQNTHRQSIKKRARSQILHSLSLQTLQEIVTQSQQQFKKDYLAILVKYSNAQFPLAVGCLGNLILDQIVRVHQLEGYSLKPGYHPNWLWLIEVLVENEYCTAQLLKHCIKSLSSKRSVKTRQRALSILLKVTACNMHLVEWIKDHNTLLSILNCCLSSEQFNEIAFGLLYQLLSKCSEQNINNFSTAVVGEKMIAILTQGSLCKSRKIKILSCKIIRELSSKSLFLPAIYPAIIRLIKQAKANSYLQSALTMLRVILERSTKDVLMSLIDAELIVELGILKQALMDEDYEEWIVFRVVQLGWLIEKQTQDCQLSKGIYRQLKRFQLLRITDKMDIY